ncbi:TetR/AcrR family transcriptional regulator [Actinoplanes sp. NPDC026670]|uniref:TetR/AcrR family transcriptional regulator n=1 Tax=Actinoplanes sp. NPDC026670 TaxID=3154700 RepID=UPI0033CE2B46
MTLKSRRRGPELEDAILDAAWAVLIEHSYAGFTYEAIAARAGTSRPVLYRRWAQREDLLLATIRKHWAAHPVELPDTGNLRDDAIGFLRNAGAGRSGMMTMLGMQLAEYFRATGTSFSDLRQHLLTPGQRTGFERLLDRAVQRGELPDVPRPPRVVNLPFDLFRHEMFMTMRPPGDEIAIEIIDQVWLPLIGWPQAR